MQLSAIRLHAGTERASLPACLEAILTAAGARVDYGSIHAVLGLPFWIAAPRRELCLGCWMEEGHDSLLVETGRHFGFRVRELHPPEAAVGLEASREFPQHFDASYRPLMDLALEHQQPILAFGRPDGVHGSWGIGTSRCAEGLGFVGVFPESPGVDGRLNAIPLQVYIVEETAPRDPSDEELLPRTFDAAGRVQRNGLDARFGIVTGPAAYDSWIRRLDSMDVCPRCGPHSSMCHARMARLVRQARRSAAAFVVRCGDALPSAQEFVAAFKDACSSVVQALERSCDERLVAGILNNPRGRSALVEDLHRARHGDEALARLIGDYREFL